VKRGRAKNRSKTAKKDAWAAAAAYGCDMNLLEASLRRTPQERINFHESALALVEALQAAGRGLEQPIERENKAVVSERGTQPDRMEEARS
jgi:hypothetical protein